MLGGQPQEQGLEIHGRGLHGEQAEAVADDGGGQRFADTPIGVDDVRGGRDRGLALGLDRRHARHACKTGPHVLVIASNSNAQALRHAGATQRVDAEQTSVEEDRDAVGHPLDLAEDVRGDQNRTLASQRANQLAHLDDLTRVEPVRRFVEDQQRGVAEQGLSDRNTLTVTA